MTNNLKKWLAEYKPVWGCPFAKEIERNLKKLNAKSTREKDKPQIEGAIIYYIKRKKLI